MLGLKTARGAGGGAKLRFFYVNTEGVAQRVGKKEAPSVFPYKARILATN